MFGLLRVYSDGGGATSLNANQRGQGSLSFGERLCMAEMKY